MSRFTIVFRVSRLVNVVVAVLPIFAGFAVIVARLLGREEDGVTDTVRDSALVYKSSPRLTLGVLLLFVFIFDGAKRLEIPVNVDFIVELTNLANA